MHLQLVTPQQLIVWIARNAWSVQGADMRCRVGFPVMAVAVTAGTPLLVLLPLLGMGFLLSAAGPFWMGGSSTHLVQIFWYLHLLDVCPLHPMHPMHPLEHQSAFNNSVPLANFDS